MKDSTPTATDRTWLQRLSLGLLSLLGWRAVYVQPPGPKGVILVYPHTSNWDFPIGILFRHGCGVRTQWMAKHTLFRWPLAPILRFLGGTPIDRRKARGTIEAMVEAFRQNDWLWLAITPEGTRSHTDHWKSGFYRIVLAADVPCALACIDYKTRTISIDTYVHLTGDTEADLAMLRDFYAGKHGLRPENEGDICFRG